MPRGGGVIEAHAIKILKKKKKGCKKRKKYFCCPKTLPRPKKTPGGGGRIPRRALKILHAESLWLSACKICSFYSTLIF